MPGLQLLLFTVSELLREPPSPLPRQTLGLKDFTVLFYRSLDWHFFTSGLKIHEIIYLSV